MMYSVKLIDYATPSFVSADKTYYGSKEEIMEVLEEIKENRPDLFRAAEEFFTGRGEGIVQVYYGAPEPFIKPVTVIGETVVTKEPFAWAHKNVWYCFYHMRADSMVCHVYYIKNEEGQIHRIIRPVFVNLRYKNSPFPDEKFTEYSQFWGHPGIIAADASEEQKCIVRNTLMCSDKMFEEIEEAQQDMKNPVKIDYSPFFDDIFGDG